MFEIGGRNEVAIVDSSCVVGIGLRRVAEMHSARRYGPAGWPGLQPGSWAADVLVDPEASNYKDTKID